MPSRKTYYESIREGQPVSQSLSVKNQGAPRQQHVAPSFHSRSEESTRYGRGGNRAHGSGGGGSQREDSAMLSFGAHEDSGAHSEYTSYPEFYFRERFEELDWKSLLQIDIDTLIHNNDLDTLEQITKNLTFGRVSKRDLKFVTEHDCIHVFQLAQLIIEYMLYVQQYLVDTKQSQDANSHKLLNDLHTLKLNASKRKQQNAHLKKDLRRQKRTIFAYQLVFGANPERAKILLQAMRDGKMDIPSSTDNATNSHNNPLIQQLNLQLDQLRRDNDQLKSQLNQVLSTTTHPSTEHFEQRINQLQTIHNQHTKQLQGQISSMAQQLSAQNQDAVQNDLKLMEYVEKKLGELLPTLVTEKEKRDVLRLSSSVREIKDRLSETYSTNEESSAVQDEEDVSHAAPSHEPTSEHNTVYKSIESVPAKLVQPTAPLEQSIKSTTQDLRKSLKNSIRKPVPGITEDTPQKKSKQDTTSFHSTTGNAQQKALFTKIKNEMDLPATVAIHNDNIPHKVSGTNNIRSKFIHKPEDFDLQKEIVRTDFDNYLNKRKLNMSRMDDAQFKKEMLELKQNRETMDPELSRVLEGVRDIVDGIVMSHNPQWAKFFDNSRAAQQKTASKGQSLVPSRKKTTSASRGELSTETTNRIAKTMQKLSSTAARSLSPDLSPAKQLQDVMKHPQKDSSQEARKRKEEPETTDTTDQVVPPPVISKPPLDPNMQPRSTTGAERRSKDRTRASKNRLRNSVSTSFSRTSADTFVSSTYSNGTFASSDYSGDSSDSDTQYEEEPRQPPVDRKPRSSNAEVAIRDRHAPSAPLKDEHPAQEIQPPKSARPPPARAVKETVFEERKQVTQTPDGRKVETIKTTTTETTTAKTTPVPPSPASIPVENLASDTTLTPRSTRDAPKRAPTPTQIMNISAMSVTNSEISDHPSPREEEQTRPKVKGLNIIKNQLARNSPTILHRKSTDSAFTEEIGLESFGEHTPRAAEKNQRHDSASETNSKTSPRSNDEWHKEKQSAIDTVLKELHGGKKTTTVVHDNTVSQALRDRDAGVENSSEFDDDEPVTVVSKKVESVTRITESVPLEPKPQAAVNEEPTIQNPFSKGITNPFSGGASQHGGKGKFLSSTIGESMSSSYSSVKDWRQSSKQVASPAEKTSALNLSDELDRGIEDLEKDDVESHDAAPRITTPAQAKVSDADLQREMDELDDNPISMDLKSDMNMSRVDDDDLEDELEALQEFDDEEAELDGKRPTNKQSIDFEILDDMDDDF